ncbi:hypothetical protein I307_03190 [Cryptococcus deuterogattii 99/473]|nr:hypothetical protein I309_04830 [Cryptococcus deuterogattii LA55]KIR92055.1 hypothetical protein I304_04222 [Cryptococcus deuterogattii CBS 10090]KIY57271.1 hypothetical protein I307_03190 [Cryptococcus deuterogattii 99/473]
MAFLPRLLISATSIATLVALYLLFTGQGEAFNVGHFLAQSSPYAWALIGVGLCIGLSVAGAAWRVGSVE